MNKDQQIINNFICDNLGPTNPREAEFLNAANRVLDKNIKMQIKIAYLKAEIKKRPEVVRCGECEILKDDIESDKSGGFCHYIQKYCSSEDFCSRGQRRESEGKE